MRLSSTEPGGVGPGQDLAILAEWVDRATIVGLGESLHGVHEFHRLGHRIFEHLAREEGFSVFALEINQAHGAALDEFVQGRRDDLDALLAERWWTAAIFYDQAFRDLLLWMRDYNETEARPVHVAGFDFKQPSFAMDAVRDGLEPLDAGAAGRAEALFAKIRALGGLGVFPNVYGYSAGLTVPLPERTGEKSVKVRVMARGGDVSHGKTGLSVSSGSAGERPTVLSLDGSVLEDSWKPIAVELNVPQDQSEIGTTIFHRGNGTVWFGGLTIEIDGRPIELNEPMPRFEQQRLSIPSMQVMDYQSSFDPEVRFADDSESLRIDCDPAVDEALRAARRVEALVEETLALSAKPGSKAKSVWLSQMARLVVQTTEWRTLVESNRDVLMAENVAWLEREGVPGGRIMALAHSSHTDRIDGRMGGFLAAEYGNAYATLKMLALSGTNRTFDVPRAYEPGTVPEPREFSINRGRAGSLEERLSMLSGGNLLVHLGAIRRSPEASEELAWRGWSDQTPDVGIVLRTVGPIEDP